MEGRSPVEVTMARYFCGQEHRTYVDNLIVGTSAQLTDKNVRSFTNHYYAGGKTDDCNSDLH